MPSPLKSPLVTLNDQSDRSSKVDKNGGNSYAAMSLCGGTNGHSDAPGSEDVPFSHGAHTSGFVAPTTTSEYVPAGHASHGVEGSESPSYVPATHSTQFAVDVEPGVE